MRQLIALALLLGTLLPAAAMRPAAAATLVDLSIQSADIRTGEPLAGACYVIVDWSEEGCDENGDARVDFQDVAVGDYVVTLTRAPSGYLRVGDFPIAVQEGDGQIFGAFFIEKSAGDGTYDIALRALAEFSTDVLTGACFLIHGGSIEGCDENNDGRVTFQDVRAGTYLVTMTQAPDGYLPPDQFWIDVSAESPKVQSVPTPEDRGQPNVTIGSVDDETGEYLLGACYIIDGGSIEGCDRNGDGFVDFRGVAAGTYTVTETQPPFGYDRAADFQIVVKSAGDQSFIVRHQPAAAGPSEFVDVAIVSRDAGTGEWLPGACYVIEDWSNEGCDENGDGRVDFAGIPHGRFAVTETRAPDGYRKRTGLQFLFSTPALGNRQFVYVDHQRA